MQKMRRALATQLLNSLEEYDGLFAHPFAEQRRKGPPGAKPKEMKPLIVGAFLRLWHDTRREGSAFLSLLRGFQARVHYSLQLAMLPA